MLSYYTIILEGKNLQEEDRLKAFSIAKYENKVSKYSKTHGFKKIREYVYLEQASIKEFLINTLFGKDDQYQLANGMPWFNAEEGVNWAKALIEFFQNNKGGVKNKENLIIDLQNAQQVFEWALENKLRWHFTIKYQEEQENKENVS